MLTEVVAVGLLAVVMVAAVVRPRGLPEVATAVPAAAVLLGTGILSLGHAADEASRLAPVVGFLAAVLVLADGCAHEGLFAAIGGLVARRCAGRPSRLLVGVFGAAALTTAVLSLDTTVVLLTPVVLVAAQRAGAAPRPHLYACAHLSNSASLLLPVSNLTNLLALAVVPMSFPRFAALMALPWLVVVLIEYVGFRWWFRGDLGGGVATTSGPVTAGLADDVAMPWFAVAVVAATLVGFVATSLAGVAPAWAAAAGALVLVVRRSRRSPVAWRHAVVAAAPGFCLFVLALGLVVRAASDHGLGSAARHLLPHGAALPALLGTTAVAALAANVVNNLPATLLLLPAAAASGPASVLAVLVGVNVGPNLTYVGSLATLLWRRVLHGSGVDVPQLREFSQLAAVTVPASLAAAVVALWASVRWIGV